MENLFSHLKERVTSPIFGPFIYFWMLTNWSAVVYLFAGNNSAQDRINEISKFLIEHPRHWEGPMWLTLGYISVVKLAIHFYEYFPRWLETREMLKDEVMATDLKVFGMYKTTYPEVVGLAAGFARDGFALMDAGYEDFSRGRYDSANANFGKLKAKLEELKSVTSTVPSTDPGNGLKPRVEQVTDIFKRYFL